MVKQNRVRVKESPITQGACESIPYVLEFKGESGLTDPSVIVYDQTETSVTNQVMGPSPIPVPTISTCEVTLPNLCNLEGNQKYDVITFVMIGTRKQSAAFRVDTFDEKDV